MPPPRPDPSISVTEVCKQYSISFFPTTVQWWDNRPSYPVCLKKMTKGFKFKQGRLHLSMIEDVA